MPFSERDKLLHDVIRDANYEAFRAELLALGRAELRRGRGQPVFVPLALAASLVIAAASFLFLRKENSAPEKPLVVPATALASAGSVVEIVRTQPLAPVEVVRSLMERSLVVESSAMLSGVEVVDSTPDAVLEIDDSQLLAHFAGRPAGLIRHGSGVEFVTWE